MAIRYEWKITALKKAPSLDGLSDVITHVNFEYKGIDGDHSAVFNGACPVGPPDKDNFKALADLTQEEVIGWAQANHPVENMQDVILKTISDKLTPKNVEVDSLPWVASAEEESEEESSEEESSEDSDDE
tara:strand:+ start:119 stop:508 length:390 start_codon:yes stop_codon:yes gene_type:complete